MSFVHPLLLWGLSLGSIPIIIHILSRRRYRIVRWAAMDFLLAALSQRSRNLRIQDLILLALRTLALVAAALLVARPILSPATAELAGIDSRGPDCVIVLDTSYSMSTNVAGQTRIALARQKAHALLASLPEQARVGVVCMDEQARPATEGLITDRTRIGAAIDQARVTAKGTDAAPAIAAALDMLKGSTAASKRVYLVTDAQARQFDRAAATLAESLARADASTGFVVLTTGNERMANLAITDLQVKSRWLRVGAPVQFDANLRDFGDPPASEADVELWVDGRKVDRRQARLTDRRGLVTFRHAFTAAGLFPIEVRLDPDAVEIDNHRYAAVAVPESIDVAVVTGDPSDKPSDSPLGGAGELAYVYLEAALSVPDGVSEQVAALPFAVRPRISPARLADELDEDVRVVILADPGLLPADALRRLERLVQRGAAVMIATGADAAATLGPFRSGEAGLGRWLGNVALTLPEPSTTEEQPVFQFDTEETASPSPIPDAGTSADVPVIDLDSPGVRESLSAVNVFQAVTVEPAGDTALSVVLRFTDGRPALLTRDLAAGERGDVAGAGRLTLFTSSLDASWSDLAFRPAMVPMLHDTLLWLVWPRLVSPTMTPGDVFSPILSGKLDGLRVLMPGDAVLEAAGFIEPVEAFEGATLQFDRTDQPGVYRLAGNEDNARSAIDALRAVAVNVDTRESDQAVRSPADIRSLFPRDHCEVIAPSVPVDAAILTGLSGTEIWSILAVLVGAVLLMEALLAYRFSYQKTSGSSSAPAPPVVSSGGQTP